MNITGIATSLFALSSDALYNIFEHSTSLSTGLVAHNAKNENFLKKDPDRQTNSLDKIFDNNLSESVLTESNSSENISQDTKSSASKNTLNSAETITSEKKYLRAASDSNSRVLEDSSLKTFSEYLKDLRFRESSDQYDNTKNIFGYLGAYQMGELALIQTGYYRAGPSGAYAAPGNTKTKNTWDGTWTGKDGVNSLSDYLQNKVAQDNAVTALMLYQWSLIRGEGLDSLLGRKIKNVQIDVDGNREDITISESGLILGAHLRGVSLLREFLLTQGDTNPTDELGTPIAEYVKIGYGYQLSNEFQTSKRREVWVPSLNTRNGYDTPCYITYGMFDRGYNPTLQEQKINSLAAAIDGVTDRSQISTTSSWNDGFLKINDPKDTSGKGYFILSSSNDGYYLPIDQMRLKALADDAIQVYSQVSKPTIRPTQTPNFKPTQMPTISFAPTTNITSSDHNDGLNFNQKLGIGVGVGIATLAAITAIYKMISNSNEQNERTNGVSPEHEPVNNQEPNDELSDNLSQESINPNEIFLGMDEVYLGVDELRHAMQDFVSEKKSVSGSEYELVSNQELDDDAHSKSNDSEELLKSSEYIQSEESSYSDLDSESSDELSLDNNPNKQEEKPQTIVDVRVNKTSQEPKNTGKFNAPRYLKLVDNSSSNTQQI